MINHNIASAIIVVAVIVIILFYWFQKTPTTNELVLPKIDFNLDGLLPMQKKIETYIRDDIKTQISPSLQDICLYCTGGKHIRAILVLSIANNNMIESAVHSALCLEYIHSASLIFDDIVDGEINRRSKPTAYNKYGMKLSQVAALQLIALSLYHLNKSLKKLKPELAIRIYDEYSQQIILLAQGEGLNLSDANASVEDIISKKTSTLFKLALVFGLLHKLNFDSDPKENMETLESNLAKVGESGEIFGQLFQMADDFEDLLEDQKSKQMNYVNVHGLDKSLMNYNSLSDKFVKLTQEQKIYTNEIYLIISFLYSKVHTYHKFWSSKVG